MKKLKLTIGAAVCMILAVLLGGGATVQAQEDEDLLLLTSQFGELCTMCEAYVRCEAVTGEQVQSSNDAAFTLYYFQTKDFWGQIATIWDWFVHLIDPVQSQNRPMTVFEKGEADKQTKLLTTAFLSLEEAKIEVPGAWIDRHDGAWYWEGGTLKGQCTRVPIGDAMALTREMEPWDEISRPAAGAS